jgi:5-methylcytosine-specific restriction protein A
MASDFLYYWPPSSVAQNLGLPLSRISGEEFGPDRVKPGDRVWIVTAPQGVLHLAARVIVGEVISYAEAHVRADGIDLGEAEYQIVAKPGTVARVREFDITPLASGLRFESGTLPRLTVVQGRVDPQELQTMRALTPGSGGQLRAVYGDAAPPAPDFVPDSVYRRRDLHRRFGGQREGRISIPAQRGLVFLFTGGTATQYGYRDSWTDDGLYLFAGEGQQGDMEFAGGNRAVLEHTGQGRDLLLFEYVRPGTVRYAGQMICAGFRTVRGPDMFGRNCKVIVFELLPLSEIQEVSSAPVVLQDDPAWDEPLELLRETALAAGTDVGTTAEGRASVDARGEAVRIYTLRRADGICEGCGDEAPFITASGRPFLETHHIRRPADGGPDHPRWVIALCPNCHRRAHYSHDAGSFNLYCARRVGEMGEAIT